MARRFTRLRRGPVTPASGAAEVPDDGLCLSAFLVLESPERPGAVLMGRLNPEVDWWELGALDPKRFARIAERWMLPSSQLLFFESPQDAAERILREQLSTPGVSLEGPFVFSDPSDRPDSGQLDPHWDIHFVFRGTWDSSAPPRARAWKHLAFVDVATTSRSEIARDQGDVLALIGLPPKG